MVLPLVFMLLLGIVWFGRAFNIYSTIQQAAQQGAITAAREACATCPGGNSPPAAAAAASMVITVMQASSLNPSQIVNNPAPANCTNSTDNITVCQEVLLNPSSNPAQPQSCGSPPGPTPSQICGAIVTFQYPFQFYLPFTSLNMQTIKLSAQAQSRMEN
jgi:Flp pilus assembly protein TadG